MTARDVLISRVHDGLGSPMYALSNSARDRVEELWAVTAEGKKSLTIHPFIEALDAALTWAAESGGEIYRRGPSWLTVLGHAKDSLWSLDLFRCESAVLHTHWVLVVMDQCTRRIVGFGVHRGVIDGVALCQMFNRATCGHTPPKYLSLDHDPLYRFHQWQASLR